MIFPVLQVQVQLLLKARAEVLDLSFKRAYLKTQWFWVQPTQSTAGCGIIISEVEMIYQTLSRHCMMGNTKGSPSFGSQSSVNGCLPYSSDGGTWKAVVKSLVRFCLPVPAAAGIARMAEKFTTFFGHVHTCCNNHSTLFVALFSNKTADMCRNCKIYVAVVEECRCWVFVRSRDWQWH